MSRVNKPVPRHGNSMLIRNIVAAAILATHGKRMPCLLKGLLLGLVRQSLGFQLVVARFSALLVDF